MDPMFGVHLAPFGDVLPLVQMEYFMWKINLLHEVENNTGSCKKIPNDTWQLFFSQGDFTDLQTVSIMPVSFCKFCC